MQGIYIHIPFCKQACSYCDFHFSTLLKNKSELVAALCSEIKTRHDYLGSNVLSSVYFGGGTPSLLDAGELQLIFEALHQYFTWDKQAELTIECNPDDLSPAKLKELRSAGFNRLSIGLQSFNDAELKWMNRAHTAVQSVTCVRAAQEAGFDNISIDLMYGSKFQDITSWRRTLQQAIDLRVQHISSYNLTIEPKTALGLAAKKGLEPDIEEEKSAEQFLLMTDLLENDGFIHYEISNFGKDGYFAVHNSNYWKGCHYLGIGPSAHSFNGSGRQWNIANNNTYIHALKHRLPYFETEVLSDTNKYNEYVLTGLRTIWGCSLKYIESRFGKKMADHFATKIKVYMPDCISEQEAVFTLTKKGKLLADKIAMELFV
ncbi:MAG: radical SAM family heme chaperone HemW [Bacteroidia bacterium]